MSLLDNIVFQRIQAMKDKDLIKKNLLTTLLGEIQNKWQDKSLKPDDTFVLSFVKIFKDKAEESLAMVQTDQAKEEINILSSFLPTMLTVEELTDIIKNLLTQEISGNKLAFVMSHLKTHYPAQYDGKVASTLIKQNLNMV